MRIKVLGVNASPRRYGGTAKLLHIALEAARREGAETELVHLYDYEIRPCLGCLSDVQEACRPPCVIDDGMRTLYDKVLEADGIIIATPVYWYGPSGHLKNFLDRLTVFENMVLLGDKSWVEGKVAGAIAVGADSGEIMSISYILSTLNSMGMLVPPWALAYTKLSTNALEDRNAAMDAANVGLIVARTAKLVKQYGPSQWYEPQLPWLDEYAGKLEAEMERLASGELAERRRLWEELIRGKPRRR